MHDVIGFEKYAGKRVLDLGCGSGVDVAEFARYGADVIGVDWTEIATRLASRYVDTARADATFLPFKDESFDLVYSFGVLHHIADMDSAMVEIRRVLKKGGEVFAMLYNRDSLLYAYTIRHLGLETEERLGCPIAECFTASQVSHLFSRYFDNVQVSTHYNVIDLPGQRKIKVGGPPELGWHLVVRGVKE
jgi:ubiquinone/menaquinone biosynthesis C-methylase UbiE